MRIYMHIFWCFQPHRFKCISHNCSFFWPRNRNQNQNIIFYFIAGLNVTNYCSINKTFCKKKNFNIKLKKSLVKKYVIDKKIILVGCKRGNRQKWKELFDGIKWFHEKKMMILNIIIFQDQMPQQNVFFSGINETWTTEERNWTLKL